MGKGFWTIIFISFAIAICPFPLSGQEDRAIIAYEKTGSSRAWQDQIITEGSDKFSIHDLIAGKADSLFKPLVPNSSLKEDSIYWIKFKVNSDSDINRWILEVSPRFDIAEIYFVNDDGKIIVQRSGISTHFSEWPLPNYKISFNLPVHTDRWFYLKLKADYDTGVGLISRDYDSFLSEKFPQNLYYGFFFGIISIATIFSLIFYFKLREKTYLFYALYVFCFALFAMVDWGIILVPLSYTELPWHRDLYTVPFASMTIFLLLYARELLELKKASIFLDNVVISAVYARIIIYVLGTAFDIQQLYSPYIDNLLLFSAYMAGISRLKKGYKAARYFLVGLSVLYLGLIIHSLENIGLIPYNVLPWFSMYRTGVVEMFFFSLALADRFRLMKQEQSENQRKTIQYLRENTRLQNQMIDQLNENEKLKDKINQELEDKVKERTRDLEEASNVILEINRFLEESNRNLADEVKKISMNRIMQKTVTFDEFRQIYPDEDTCYSFLEKMKWSSGYKCKKCGYRKYSTGNTPYSRRCSRCNYIERITSDTIFAHTKFPITKAFYLLFLVNSGKNLTIESLSEMLNLRKQTVWYFRKKIMEVMKSNPRKKARPDEGWSRWVLPGQLTRKEMNKNH
jgi:hypothetical protein